MNNEIWIDIIDGVAFDPKNQQLWYIDRKIKIITPINERKIIFGEKTNAK